MSRPTRFAAAGLALTLALGGVAACGSSDSPAQDQKSTTTVSNPDSPNENGNNSGADTNAGNVDPGKGADSGDSTGSGGNSSTGSGSSGAQPGDTTNGGNGTDGGADTSGGSGNNNGSPTSAPANPGTTVPAGGM